jgi:hypothetical protein
MHWLKAGLVAFVLASSSFISPSQAAPVRMSDLASTQAVLHWISLYRRGPDPTSVPKVMRTLSTLGAFNDPEHCGVYAGFFAGVLAANPRRAEALIAQTLKMKSDDRWMVVRAIAHSGLPNWKYLLRQFADRIPSRKVMIDRYIEGNLPTLAQFTIAPEPSTWDRLEEKLHLDAIFGEPPKKLILEPSADVLDLLWGYYFGTGSYGPIMHIVALLAWSQDRNDVERLAIGSMAKYTLASNAMHDRRLLAMLKDSRAARGQPKKIVEALKEIIDAAETVQTGKLRQEALAAINEVKTKGPAYKRTLSMWSYLGQTAIAGGCVAAAVSGLVALGLPCVVGGATSSAVMNFLSNMP